LGLSILIPVYNYDVTELSTVLSDQLKQTGKDGEIILLDDASDESFHTINQKLTENAFVKYLRNETNKGRTETRKLLADSARFDHLLFLDCDSRIIKHDFLSVYFTEVESDALVVTGGRIYTAIPPTQCEYRLHWKYGSSRESLEKRTAFMSNNFLIQKNIFQKLDLSSVVKGYGHEDSYWGIQFRQMGIALKKINNPVLHDKLERSEVFLQKTKQSLENLLSLSQHVEPALLTNEIRIYRWYRRLRILKMAALFAFLESFFNRRFRKNLVSCKPSLFFFDLYRLALLIRLARKKSVRTLSEKNSP
jgi:glycosyltransferase involved in cell wall biosynthesis